MKAMLDVTKTKLQLKLLDWKVLLKDSTKTKS